MGWWLLWCCSIRSLLLRLYLRLLFPSNCFNRSFTSIRKYFWFWFIIFRTKDINYIRLFWYTRCSALVRNRLSDWRLNWCSSQNRLRREKCLLHLLLCWSLGREIILLICKVSLILLLNVINGIVNA